MVWSTFWSPFLIYQIATKNSNFLGGKTWDDTNTRPCERKRFTKEGWLGYLHFQLGPPFTGARQFHHDFLGGNSLRKSHHILSIVWYRRVGPVGEKFITPSGIKNTSFTVLLDIAHCWFQPKQKGSNPCLFGKGTTETTFFYSSIGGVEWESRQRANKMFQCAILESGFFHGSDSWICLRCFLLISTI